MKIFETDISDIDVIYNIMEKSFPTNEIRTFEYYKNQFADSRFKVYINKEKTAFIGVWCFEKFNYIEHFAVAPEKRGSGLGGAIIKKIIEKSKLPLVLEAEVPESHIQKRRIEFYKRAGFKLNDFYYFQPSMRDNEEGVELKILSYPQKLDEKEFKERVSMIYKEVYKM